MLPQPIEMSETPALHRFFLLNQEDRLARQIEPFPATNIAAGNHVIDTDHVGARSLEVLPVLLVRPAWKLSLLVPHHPANRESVFLSTVWADQRDLLRLLFLIVKPSLVHIFTAWRSAQAQAAENHNVRAHTAPARKRILLDCLHPAGRYRLRERGASA